MVEEWYMKPNTRQVNQKKMLDDLKKDLENIIYALREYLKEYATVDEIEIYSKQILNISASYVLNFYCKLLVIVV